MRGEGFDAKVRIGGGGRPGRGDRGRRQPVRPAAGARLRRQEQHHQTAHRRPRRQQGGPEQAQGPRRSRRAADRNNLQAIFGTPSENLKTDMEEYLKTAGDEAELSDAALSEISYQPADGLPTVRQRDPFAPEKARGIIDGPGGPGGPDNIVKVDAVAETRLRLGEAKRYGLIYVDRNDGSGTLERYEKKSFDLVRRGHPQQRRQPAPLLRTTRTSPSMAARAPTKSCERRRSASWAAPRTGPVRAAPGGRCASRTSTRPRPSSPGH